MPRDYRPKIGVVAELLSWFGASAHCFSRRNRFCYGVGFTDNTRFSNFRPVMADQGEDPDGPRVPCTISSAVISKLCNDVRREALLPVQLIALGFEVPT